MTDLIKEISYSGRANAVFVFGSGVDSKAVISPVVVRLRENESKVEERVRFIGTTTFNEKTAKHIEKVVLTAADNIFCALGLPKKCIDISIVNLEAASIKDVGLNISGFSADVPIILAILSAGLQILIPGDVVSTGHIASIDGDIRMVKGLPYKLTAATLDQSIHTFIHPAIDQDSSLYSLSPKQKRRIIEAHAKAKKNLKTIAVRDINELVQSVFTDEQIVLASLKLGFFKVFVTPFAKESPSKTPSEFLAINNEKRFWTFLERQLIAGRSADAGELLSAFTRFYTRKRKYPKGFGGRLFQLVQSLPPDVRRRKLAFPLIPVSDCIKLSQFADEYQNKDVLLMFKAISGEKIHITPEFELCKQRDSFAKELQSDTLLKTVLLEISADTLTTRIGLPIDSARAAYLMDSVIVESHDEFSEMIASFYIHLLRHTHKAFDPIDMDVAGAEGFALLERAFSNKGGFQAALAEARNATNGGLRFVLDLMTEQFKSEQQQKHIGHVLKLALDPLDWQGKVNLMKSLLDRLKSHLPMEITSQPSERYASHYEGIIEAYIKSMDQVKSIFRSI